MGDRSYVSMQILHCPQKDWDGLIELLRQFSIGIGANATYPTEFPHEIIEEEVRLGSLSDACALIAVAHPEAYFWGQQDAYYEYYGDRCINVEEGYSWRETDNSGHVALTPDHLEKIDTQPGHLKEKLLDHFGVSYVKAAREWLDGKRTPQFQIEEVPSIL